MIASDANKQLSRRHFLAGTLAAGIGPLSPDIRLGESKDGTPINDITLNYHLMHPGGDSEPGDPNLAFWLDGVYHLHYIIRHPFQGPNGFSFVHVSSPDMLHWTWRKTNLQRAFTGHGMFSGTGFLTKEGKPAAIYNGWGSDRIQIAIAKDNSLEQWEKPYPFGLAVGGDPDCFLIGDTYYAISSGGNPPLFKSKDLRSWTPAGNLLAHDLSDVIIGEDISCGNFFRLGNKWMLLCISHTLGCRYYIGDWDAKAERFVPERHGRMNWRREDQALYGFLNVADFFAPESLLAADDRRVMWAWCATLGAKDGRNMRSIQSLPRELSLDADGSLRIRPLRELQSLRYNHLVLREMQVTALADRVPMPSISFTQRLAKWTGDAVEIRIVIRREHVARRLLGFMLFPDGQGGGLPILLRPDTRTLRVGTTDAPFSVADLPAGEDLEMRIFIDKYLVEVFVNDRQAVVAAHLDYAGKQGLDVITVAVPTTIESVEVWNLKPTNQGFLDAQTNQVWEPQNK
jgi:sucrose-6-phosphate hydrolase SacC (GH32 family)